MGAFSAWLDQNWFTLIQSIGIIGSLWLTGATLRRESRARRVGDLLALTGHHRELWAEVHRRPELGRILQSEVDLVSTPISIAEEEFLNLVFVHFQTGTLLAKEGSGLGLDALAADAKKFFALPIPQAVWMLTKAQRDPAFVDFIDNLLGERGRTRKGPGSGSRNSRKARSR